MEKEVLSKIFNFPKNCFKDVSSENILPRSWEIANALIYNYIKYSILGIGNIIWVGMIPCGAYEE